MKVTNDEAVSPVIGVMLMLVVTIIIAAVLSAFAGGLASTDSKAPTATVDVKIISTGGSGTKFVLNVLSVSEPIPTKNLKLTTSYTLSDGTRGGATCFAGTENTNFTSPNPKGGMYGPYRYNSPLGYGPGVGNWTTSGQFYPDQNWGNYTWVSGTYTAQFPSSNYYNYAYNVVNPTDAGTGDNDGTDALGALLGKEWTGLRLGDVVNVKVIHIPSGKTIVNKNVIVEG